MPLKTRDGVAEAPIEPGLRTLCEPCVTRAAAEVVALDRALEALADADPRDLHLVARLEDLDRDALALDGAVEVRRGTRRGGGRRLDAEPCRWPSSGLRDLALGDGSHASCTAS